ncbi:hypothetical protein [Salmonella phage SSBI34]|nr:hypothetical protein [Salmonella phage SSBI34]
MIGQYKILVTMTVDYDNPTIAELVEERISKEGVTLQDIHKDAQGMLIEAVEEMIKESIDENCDGLKLKYEVIS